MQKALPSVSELLEAGRLVRQPADVRALREALQLAARDINAADANR
jgi:hypothetical protein